MIDRAEAVTVNGKRFVAGLYWQSLQRPRAFLQEAREIGRRENMDVVAIRRGRVLQAGFGASSTIGNSAAYSLAAALARVLGDDWIAVFALGPDNYAIAASKNGAIIPGCDAVGTQSEILDRLRSNFNLHHFARVISPSEFGFGGEDVQLDALLLNAKLTKEDRLRTLATGVRKEIILGGLALLLLMGAGGGYYFYREYKEEQERIAAAAAAAAKQRRLAALERSAAAKAPPVALPHPWATQPKADAFLASCVATIHALPISMGGWLLESGSCTDASVRAVFKREPSANVNGFHTRAQALQYQGVSMDDKGEVASVVVAFTTLPAGGDDALLPHSQMIDAVRSVLQSRQLTFSIARKPPPAPPPQLPGEDAPPPPPPPDWTTSTLTASGKNAPADMLAGLDRLPGFRLLTVAVARSEHELTWSLTGEINGN